MSRQNWALPMPRAQEIIAASDFLCVLLPYMTETDLSINEETFAAMKPGAFVVHCGSGSVIDEEALVVALQSGHLAGAALDTFEWEPLRADNPLVALARDPAANVLLTPHTAAATLPGGRIADWALFSACWRGKIPCIGWCKGLLEENFPSSGVH